MLAQKSQRILELEAQQVELRQNQLKVVVQLQERIEILDWYHLIENLYKVGGSFQRIEEVKCFLWKGEVDAAISCARRMVRAASGEFYYLFEQA